MFGCPIGELNYTQPFPTCDLPQMPTHLRAFHPACWSSWSDSYNDLEPNSRSLFPVPLLVIHPRTASSFARAKKRNVSNCDIGGAISDREVLEMTAIVESLREDVEHWIRTNHAALL